MTEVLYIAGTVGVLVLGLWLWRRHGRYVSGAWFATIATTIVGLELAKFLYRGQARKTDRSMPESGTDLPVLGSEQQRRELAKALKSGERRLVEARKDGTAALKAELDRNRGET